MSKRNAEEQGGLLCKKAPIFYDVSDTFLALKRSLYFHYSTLFALGIIVMSLHNKKVPLGDLRWLCNCKTFPSVIFRGICSSSFRKLPLKILDSRRGQSKNGDLLTRSVCQKNARFSMVDYAILPKLFCVAAPLRSRRFSGLWLPRFLCKTNQDLTYTLS